MNVHLETTDIEKAFWAYDKASVSNITEMVRLEGFIPFDLLRESVEYVVALHPYFRHTFLPDGSGLVAHPTSTIDWKVVESGTPGGWARQAEKEMHFPFDLTRLPLFRATVVLNSTDKVTLLLTLPHVVAAGVGALNCAKDILEVLDSKISGKPGPHLQERRFLRPQATHFDPRRSQPPTWIRSEASDDGIQMQATPAPVEWGVDPGPEGAKATWSYLQTVVLTQPATQRLLEMCRTEDVPLNAYLTASLMVAIDAELRARGTPGGMKISSALDFRGMLPDLGIEAQDLGMWASRFNLYAKLPEGCPAIAAARAYQAGAFNLLRRSAFSEIRAMTSGVLGVSPPSTNLVIPHGKITNLGDLDEQGLAPEFRSFRATSLQSLTALHRGWLGTLGYGLIPSVYHYQLQLSFFSALPWSLGVKNTPWARNVLGALLADPDTDMVNVD